MKHPLSFVLVVGRAPIRVDTLPYKVEQLTWEFTDMTATGGRMAILWDKTMGWVLLRSAGETSSLRPE
jgi:hypothetical protein